LLTNILPRAVSPTNCAGSASAIASRPARSRQLRLRDHRRAAIPVVAARACRRSVERVGPVIGIVEAAPTRVRGVEQEARVEHRHDQLRARHRRYLGVDVRRADGEVARFGDEVADLFEKPAIGLRVVRLPAAFDVPAVDPGLQLVALGEQRPVARGVFRKEIGEALPERIGRLAERAEHLDVHEARECAVHLQPGLGHDIAHVVPRKLSRAEGNRRALN
jgi:hypothetical protein